MKIVAQLFFKRINNKSLLSIIFPFAIYQTTLGLERYWYWVVGYWAIFTAIGQYCYCGTFFVVLTPNTIPIREQSAPSHMPVNDYLVPLVTCTLTDAIICLDTMLISYCLLNTTIVIIIEFWDFSWSLLYYNYTLVSVLVLGIGIARGQYYWILDIGCLSWYRSNPRQHLATFIQKTHYKNPQ